METAFPITYALTSSPQYHHDSPPISPIFFHPSHPHTTLTPPSHHPHTTHSLSNTPQTNR
ncbi:hypothetical protein [Rubritalea tangerina]|uniref:hypothetical protein n=1 Tax=Rubritalea tangerina TaxID=430798 RepID=UPI0036164230